MVWDLYGPQRSTWMSWRIEIVEELLFGTRKLCCFARWHGTQGDISLIAFIGIKLKWINTDS